MLEIHPVTATIGAEVRGINLADVDGQTKEALHKAWLQWKVLFFRDQDITTDQQIAFGAMWGALETHPFVGSDGEHPELVVIDSTPKRLYAASNWHSDVTWRPEPSLGSILLGRVIPPLGGDTLFANAGAAYQRLSDKWKARIAGRFAIHDFTLAFGHNSTPEQLAQQRAEHPPARHPVVRTHPETGEQCIYTNRSFVSHIEGVDDQESLAILRHLERAIMDPSIQCRFRWQPNSIAMWDNRCTQHYATNDHFPERRRVERVTIIGDAPH